MDQQILILIICLIAPILWWRGLFFLVPKYFSKPLSRSVSGLPIHHNHYGIILVTAAVIAWTMNANETFITVLFGLGLGLIWDGVWPSLLTPSDRPLELEIYKKSLNGTLIISTLLSAIILLSTFM